MSEEKKTHKKKLLTRYLILAACILVIAAITVTTIFAVNDWFGNDIKIDSGVTNQNVPDAPDNPDTPDTPDTPDNPDTPDTPDTPASSDAVFVAPVSTVSITYGYEFGKDATLGHYRFHTGIDLAADAGASVVACLDGTVESVVLGDELDGNTVTLTHANGLQTVYSFIDVKSDLKAGDTVKQGDVIGTVAQPVGSEYRQGAHLHFAVLQNGEFADPEDYLAGSQK